MLADGPRLAPVEIAGLSLPEAIEQYLTAMRVERNLAANTLETYRRHLERFSRFCAARGVATVTAVDLEVIEGFIAEVSRGGAAVNTVRGVASSVRSMLRWLKEEDLAACDPAEALDLPKRGRKLPRVPSVAEIERLLKAPDRKTVRGVRDAALLELIFSAGMRVSEACDLRLDAVDFATGTVRILGKGSKERLVPLGGRAAALLRRYLAKARPRLVQDSPSEHVFITRLRGAPTRQIVWKIIKRHARAAGIRDLSPHSLRHLFATSMICRGASLRDVQLLLGHTSPTVTEGYVHLSTAHLRAVYDRCHPRA